MNWVCFHAVLDEVGNPVGEQGTGLTLKELGCFSSDPLRAELVLKLV